MDSPAISSAQSSHQEDPSTTSNSMALPIRRDGRRDAIQKRRPRMQMPYIAHRCGAKECPICRPAKPPKFKVIREDVTEVECTICTKKKPSKALKCVTCKQWVGCRDCVLTWIETCDERGNERKCLLCRAEWNHLHRDLKMNFYC